MRSFLGWYHLSFSVNSSQQDQGPINQPLGPGGSTGLWWKAGLLWSVRKKLLRVETDYLLIQDLYCYITLYIETNGKFKVSLKCPQVGKAQNKLPDFWRISWTSGRPSSSRHRSGCAAESRLQLKNTSLNAISQSFIHQVYLVSSYNLLVWYNLLEIKAWEQTPM